MKERKKQKLKKENKKAYWKANIEKAEIAVKRNSGITLVALVVTIVVLLILAGITINLVLSDDGIIKKTQEAETEHRAGQVEDEVAVWKASKQMNKYLQTEIKTRDELIDEQVGRNLLTDIEAQEAREKGSVKIGSKTINYGEETGKTPTLPVVEWPTEKWGEEKDNVTPIKSEDNQVVPVPDGFVPSTINGEKKVEEGFVIKQGTDGSKTQGINEFVWVPVLHPKEMFEEVEEEDSDGNKTGKTIQVGILYDFGTSSSPKNPPEKIPYSGSGYREPDIVTSYDNTASYYTNAGITGISNADEFKTQLQNEFSEMQASVEKYKGFYIGRYETGDLSQITAVVQKNNTDIHSQDWYVQYQKSKGIYNVDGIKTSMIWGCCWDATLRWFQTSSKEAIKNFPTNSEGKGVYGESESKPTGQYAVNNIYDMAGNVYDWTIEANRTNLRVLRWR